MDIIETISKARDAINVKRVYGDPYERDGVVVIPAASDAARAQAASPRAAFTARLRRPSS